MNIQPYAIPNLAPDEEGYKIGADNYASVRITRSVAAAASMVGVTAIAFAVNVDGTPLLGPGGDSYEASHTSSSFKKDLLLATGKVDSDKVRGLKQNAAYGAIEEMMALIAADTIMDI